MTGAAGAVRARRIRAVVFDFDGVVVDSETAEYEAWREIFEAHGAEVPVERWNAIIGTASGLDTYAMLRELASAPVAGDDEIRARKRARVMELVGADPLPGVDEWLDEAERRGLAVAIASSSPPDWIDAHLERLARRHRFAHLSCFDGTCEGKPAPDLYLRACAGLGVDPHDALAVEDSPNGVAAARAAGLWCLAVPRGVTAAFDFSAAHHVAPSLAAFGLGEAVALAEGR